MEVIACIGEGQNQLATQFRDGKAAFAADVKAVIIPNRVSG